MTDIPHDHLGHPDLQALVRQCGGELDATAISDRGLFRLLAKNLSPGVFRLLQHNLPGRDIATAFPTPSQVLHSFLTDAPPPVSD